ncbi:hypothetical protein [Mangrovibacterium marinum]|uniref:P pilus assembly chaperone PapD n=1 Tax=Mangrovibacterium marinum TaxID=1639118 RepID=A0A2T5C6H7_9BACT|nr:hypothetical protein [Mangrovibacterium marinum]PTN10553.1 hypothetical protein C8N47_101203 [Mangrovibacterium marinum]
MTKQLLSTLLLILSFSALEAQNFEVAPTRLDFNLEPGQNGRMQLNIINHASSPKDYTINLSDFVVDSLNNVDYKPVGSTQRTLESWLSISPTFFTLQPNESTKIDITISTPAGEEGNATKWGTLFIQEVEEQNEMLAADKSTKAGIIINPSIGVYVIQSPASGQNESATISNFRETAQSGTLAADIKNTGDKVLMAKVSLIVSNLQTAEENTLEAVEINLLPGVKKTVELKLPDNMLPGDYSITAVLDYSPNKDLEGALLDYTVK